MMSESFKWFEVIVAISIFGFLFLDYDLKK